VTDRISLAQLRAAANRIGPLIWRTPLVRSADLSCATGAQVYLKMECWQHTGSFKVRGALAKVATLSAEERARGIVTASAGNHGLGVAYAAQTLGGCRASIFVPETASPVKLARLAGFDCQVHRAGGDYDACHALAVEYAREHGLTYVSAYDDEVVIGGQGTVGLEILEDLPDADLMLVPVGGGGLLAGIAAAAQALRAGTRVVGVQPEASPAAYLSFRDGRPYETYPAGPTICDGLAGGFGRVPFELARCWVDRVEVVPEAAVRHAVAWLARREQVLAEGSGAIAIAPLLTGQVQASGQRVACVLTGRHIDSRLVQEVLGEVPEP
jgi:threonine dehydratase